MGYISKTTENGSAQSTVTSPNFLVWKFCEKSQFPHSFRRFSTCVLEAGLSDFHLMTVTVMRKIFEKLKPRTINHRSYKHFSNEAYRESLLHKPSKEVFANNFDGLQRFCDIKILIF